MFHMAQWAHNYPHARSFENISSGVETGHVLLIRDMDADRN